MRYGLTTQAWIAERQRERQRDDQDELDDLISPGEPPQAHSVGE